MKKPTAKQLEARRKFAYIMKHGGFKKKSKRVKSKSDPQFKKLKRSIRRDEISMKQKRLEMEIGKIFEALQNPNIKEIIIRK